MHVRGIYTRKQAGAYTNAGGAHTCTVCDMHTAHVCTNVCMLAQTVDSIMTLVSLPPDQSSQLPLDLQERHSFLTTGEGGSVCVCVGGETRRGGIETWGEKCHVLSLINLKRDVCKRAKQFLLSVYFSATVDKISFFYNRLSRSLSHLTSLGLCET